MKYIFLLLSLCAFFTQASAQSKTQKKAQKVFDKYWQIYTLDEPTPETRRRKEALNKISQKEGAQILQIMNTIPDDSIKKNHHFHSQLNFFLFKIYEQHPPLRQDISARLVEFCRMEEENNSDYGIYNNVRKLLQCDDFNTATRARIEELIRSRRYEWELLAGRAEIVSLIPFYKERIAIETKKNKRPGAAMYMKMALARMGDSVYTHEMVDYALTQLKKPYFVEMYFPILLYIAQPESVAALGELLYMDTPLRDTEGDIYTSVGKYAYYYMEQAVLNVPLKRIYRHKVTNEDMEIVREWYRNNQHQLIIIR